MTAAELAAERLAARTADEILDAEARIAWAKMPEHHGAECPPDRVPATLALAAWLPECPAKRRAAAAAGMDRVALALMAAAPLHTPLGEALGWPRSLRPHPGGSFAQHAAAPTMQARAMATFARRWLLTDPAEAGWFTPTVTPDWVAEGWDGTGDPPTVTLPPAVERLHALWLLAREHAPALRHPLAPLVAAWQQRPTERAPRVLGDRASLARLSRLGEDEAHLPDFPNGGPPPPADGQLLFDLPDLGDVVSGCASWLLWLFDRAGGESLSSGRGAPWDLRLFVYALLHLDVADRDGAWHTIRVAASPEHAKRLQDATGRWCPNVEDWLHPTGWANRRRDWHNLPAALDRMRRLAYVPVPGIGRVAVLFPSVIPSTPANPLVEWTIRIPRVGANGDRLNWPRLLAYGADSARLFRAYLAVTSWLGRSAKRGHPITRQIAAPVRGPDGKPSRRKGGAIIRSATERIDNPAARYVGPPLSEADLTRMIGFDPSNRKLRQYARAAFARMEADGVIEIERSGAGWLLFGGPNG